MNSYGCVKCQTRHFEGIDQNYYLHLYHQSKHGITDEIIPVTTSVRTSEYIFEQTEADGTVYGLSCEEERVDE